MQTINLQQKKDIDLSSLFERLLHHRDSQADCSQSEELGPWLHHQLSAGVLPSFPHLPFELGTYTRTYISKESPDVVSADESTDSLLADSSSSESLFEALVMRWDEQSKTSIHGHPKFSFYHVMSGVFEIELFDQSAPGELHTKEIQRLVPDESTWFSGDSCDYDNCIHRVTCLEPGLTFHVYSDDALKGFVFK